MQEEGSLWLGQEEQGYNPPAFFSLENKHMNKTEECSVDILN